MILCHENVVFKYKQVLATISSCLICLCTGICIGLVSVMLPKLREDKSIEYHPSHESWIASASMLTLIIGSVCSGPILDRYGRRTALIIIGLPYIMGWIIISCANYTSIIILGRVITGFTSGANKPVAMTYIGEIVEPKIRSIALLLPGLATHIGVLLAHAVGYFLTWKISALLCILPSILSIITALYLRESPFWLISKGRTEKGIETFRWFRGINDDSEAELKAILDKQIEKSKLSAKESLKIMKTRAFITPMLILTVVLLDSVLSGLIVVLVYSMDIIKKAFSGNVDPFIMTIVMDCFRTAVSMCTCGLGLVISKKNALIACSFAASISVFGFVACSITNFNNLWIPAICLLSYWCFSSILSIIAWTFVPELLPGNFRALGSGFISGFYFLVVFALLKTAPGIINSYGTSALFTFFGVSSLIGGVILCFILPDTNGKTLQSIEDSFKKEPKAVEK